MEMPLVNVCRASPAAHNTNEQKQLLTHLLLLSQGVAIDISNLRYLENLSYIESISSGPSGSCSLLVMDVLLGQVVSKDVSAS